MKTTLLYGFIMTLVGTLFAYLMFFLGYHDTAEKMASAQSIAMVVGILNAITCLTLGLRARRAEVPASEPFGYGRALGNGTLIALWGALFGAISHVIYVGLVNPAFREIGLQAEIAKMEAKGMSATQIEQAEPMMRMMFGPAPQGIFAFIFGFFFCFLIALIVAIFVRRPASSTTPA